MSDKYCCAEFEEQTKETHYGDGGFHKYSGEDTWSIWGCCGGGCSVLGDTRFCPFCEASIVGFLAPPWGGSPRRCGSIGQSDGQGANLEQIRRGLTYAMSVGLPL
jgi:hypothetical protein